MKELTVDAVPESLRQIRAFVDAELAALGCSVETRRQLDVAVDEVFANIARYAYGGAAGRATVRFAAEQAPRAVTLTFVDGGMPFDPLQMETPDTTLAARERKIGGLGIFLVKQLMDEVAYAYIDGNNILTIRKTL